MGTTTTQAVAVREGHHGDHGTRSGRAVARLSARLIRRGAVAMGIGLSALMALEALAFKEGYPDAASRAALTMWGKDPGIRMMSGPPTAVETVGGFSVWDAGLYLTLILAAWALTTTTRVLRGDEDAGRSEVLLAGPVRPARALLIQFLVLLGACAAIGAAVALALALSGAQVEGSVLYGAAAAGYGAALVGLAGLVCQVYATRGAALRVAGSALVALILLRLVSNSSDAREWLGWLTPGGWLDQARAFGENRWPVLLVPLAVTAALVTAATVLRERRDSGAGLLARKEVHRSRRWGLGSPVAFAWRSNLGVLFAWAVGITIAGLVVGVLLPTMDEYLKEDIAFRDILAAMGMDANDLTRGFLSVLAVTLGMVIAVYCAFRMGAARGEEASTRVELLLTRPVPRWRWLVGHVLGMVVAAVLLCALGGAALWLGAIAAGARLDAADGFTALFNTLPAIAVFAGLAVLVFGVAPRLTVPVGAAAVVVAYVLELVGPILEWPAWVLGISPFHHLEAVPVDPFALPAAVALVVIGSVLAAVGLLAFERRDLVGA